MIIDNRLRIKVLSFQNRRNYNSIFRRSTIRFLLKISSFQNDESTNSSSTFRDFQIDFVTRTSSLFQIKIDYKFVCLISQTIHQLRIFRQKNLSIHLILFRFYQITSSTFRLIISIQLIVMTRIQRSSTKFSRKKSFLIDQ